MRILSSSAKFSAGRPYTSATMATTYGSYRLGAVASLFFGDWKYASPLFGPCLFMAKRLYGSRYHALGREVALEQATLC